MLKVEIHQLNKPSNLLFEDWVTATVQKSLQTEAAKDYGHAIEIKMPINVNNTDGIKYVVKGNAPLLIGFLLSQE